MKASKEEFYKISKITKADFLFLLEVIDRLSLDENSSIVAQQSLKNWKSFKDEVYSLSSSSEENSVTSPNTTSRPNEIPSCDGCEALKEQDGGSILTRVCPISLEKIPLCNSCYEIRSKIVES